jgi:hypothetical protein
MVFVLLMEFNAPSDDEETKEQAMGQQTLDPMPAMFDKRTKSTAVALHLGVFYGIVHFHGDALWCEEYRMKE